jgi:hypothetical protein
MLKNYKNIDLASCYLLSTTKENQIKENWRNITLAPSLQKVHNVVSDSLHFIKRWLVKIIM